MPTNKEVSLEPKSSQRPELANLLSTVWKFHEFSVIQILREINFGGSYGSFQTAIFFAILQAFNFVSLVNFSLHIVKILFKD